MILFIFIGNNVRLIADSYGPKLGTVHNSKRGIPIESGLYLLQAESLGLVLGLLHPLSQSQLLRYFL